MLLPGDTAKGGTEVSDEQFQELRIPRRKFLKRAAVGAFVAPVVVSFGLEGVAEASSGRHFGNQTCANQTFPNQFFQVEKALLEIIAIVLNALHYGQINRWQGTAITETALAAALLSAEDDCTHVCRLLETLMSEIRRLPSGAPIAELEFLTQAAQSAAGCLR